ncbi:hypothetical protein Sru01_60690 [Sphaerisporangium rufum]|uniref:Uncharacterized protein n=1 Tax=Sphaerisporangium rufum TaxID=1381558 RepID=A0A919V3Q5_9ACTN|nr:hypothetical protein [Sphaerisporangium rufum]GII81087.1 hypothetical protein Sru01_60690 [Sphaerisporangium rufum]
MAVPPLHAADLPVPGRSRPRFLLRDILAGTLAVLGLPLAIVTIPNTMSIVAGLLPPELVGDGILRAHGLALPVMLGAVPPAAMVLRRVSPASLLMAGLALLAAADVAGGVAASIWSVGLVRGLHGLGAGLVLPATLAICRRSRGTGGGALVAVWAASLAVSLLAAQALALWPLNGVTSWRVALQPYPLPTGLALALAAVFLVLSRLDGDPAGTPPGSAAGREAGADPADEAAPAMWSARSGRRAGARGRSWRWADGRPGLALAPSAGLAALAVGAVFSQQAEVITGAAVLAVAVLVGTIWAARPWHGAGLLPVVTLPAVGLAVLPAAAQLTYVELAGLGGPGLSAMWRGFAVAMGVASVLALTAARAGRARWPRLLGGGLVAMVLGLCAVRLVVPAASGGPLLAPLVLLAGGAAVAVTVAMRSVPERTAMFGLSLCLPAMLAGILVGAGIQVRWLRAAGRSGAVTSQAMLDGFVGALHVWALAAGFTVVAVLVLSALAAGREGVSALAGLAPPAGPIAPAESAPAAGVRAGRPDVRVAGSAIGDTAPMPCDAAPATEPWPAVPVGGTAAPEAAQRPAVTEPRPGGSGGPGDRRAGRPVEPDPGG